jgi:hypothetical protein
MNWNLKLTISLLQFSQHLECCRFTFIALASYNPLVTFSAEHRDMGTTITAGRSDFTIDTLTSQQIPGASMILESHMLSLLDDRVDFRARANWLYEISPVLDYLSRS